MSEESKIQIRSCGSALGAEVRGVDLSRPLTEAESHVPLRISIEIIQRRASAGPEVPEHSTRELGPPKLECASA